MILFIFFERLIDGDEHQSRGNQQGCDGGTVQMLVPGQDEKTENGPQEHDADDLGFGQGFPHDGKRNI